jgi:RHS repeat-associated protein
VIWQDAAGRRHPVISSVAGMPGYRYGNGLQLHARLNAQGRAHQLVLQKPGHAPLWTARLGYTHTGLVASEHHVYQPSANSQNNEHGTTATMPRHTSLWSYAYNQRKQLVGARGQPALTQSQPETVERNANQRHDKAQTTSPGNATAAYWYAWHDDGSLAAIHHQNQTTQPGILRTPSGLPQHVENYSVNYGPNRRLTQVSLNKQALVQYLHNAYGHRIVRRTEQEQTHYLYLNQQVTAERRVNLHALQSAQDPEPLITRRYVYAGITPIGLIDYQQNAQGNLFAVHADFTGAPRVLTDQQGQVRWLADYSPTGKATKVLGDMTLWLRLPGQLEDPVTGWHDNLLRTYLPEHGQYLEPDPLGPVPGQQAVGYAAQQPRRHVDPTGLLLFAFDGTRQDASTGGNVWKLSQAYRDGPAYYHRGPGNSQELDWNALTAADAQQILTTQWQHLLNEIEKHNNRPTPLSIDIVGFSRGAALAREFANRIHQQSPGGYFSVNDNVRGTLNACVDLRFMGLFDTVAQFGLAGSQNDQYNLSIAPVWTWVAHAVALHERRWLFPLSTAYDSAAHNVIEAPFIGAHADIGGGQLQVDEPPDDTTAAGDLANVALAWMAWQARAAGLVFDLPGNQRESTNPLLHDERSALIRQLQNGDRSVLDSNSRLLHTYQQEHARLGEQPRKQTEQIIEREHDWLASADNIVGTIDMNAYARWLRDTLGWGALPA